MKKFIILSVLLAGMSINGFAAAKTAAKTVNTPTATETSNEKGEAPAKAKVVKLGKIFNYSQIKAGKGYSLVNNGVAETAVHIKGNESNKPSDNTQVVRRIVYKDGHVGKKLHLVN